MTIAELFVNLSVKGGDSAQKAVKGVADNLKGVADMSLEAKAAILGVVWGLEHMMSQSAKQGMELHQFAIYTGVSADALQRWQYMARQSGVAADDMQTSFESVQASMDKMATGQGPIKGLQAVGLSLRQTSGVNLDIDRAKKDTVYLMEMLRLYARTTKDTPQRANDWLSSFGLSRGVITMMRESLVDLSKIPKSELMSGNEIGKLKNVEVAWKNLGAMIERAFGHMTAKSGMQIVQNLTTLTGSLIKMVEGFERLGAITDSIKVLDAIFRGWGSIFAGIGLVIDRIAPDKGKKGVNDKLSFQNQMKELFSGGLGEWFANGLNVLQEAHGRSRQKGVLDPALEHHIVPRVPRRSNDKGASNARGDTNVVVNNHGVKDTGEGVEHYERALQFAYRQNPAQFVGA